jgi:hypothetical protein
MAPKAIKPKAASPMIMALLPFRVLLDRKPLFLL